jgi:hypothetical protein
VPVAPPELALVPRGARPRAEGEPDVLRLGQGHAVADLVTGTGREGGGGTTSTATGPTLVRSGHGGMEGAEIAHHTLILVLLVGVHGLGVLPQIVEAGELLAAVAGEGPFAGVFSDLKRLDGAHVEYWGDLRLTGCVEPDARSSKRPSDTPHIPYTGTSSRVLAGTVWPALSSPGGRPSLAGAGRRGWPWRRRRGGCCCYSTRQARVANWRPVGGIDDGQGKGDQGIAAPWTGTKQASKQAACELS